MRPPNGNSVPCIRTCHLILNKCYYSIPYPYRGEKLWVRADLKLLRVYREHQLIKTHVRVFEPGTWQTDEADYPPDKRVYLEQTPAYCRAKRSSWGPEVGRYMETHPGRSCHEKTCARPRRCCA